MQASSSRTGGEAMAKRERRRVRSSIDQLPTETREKLEGMLADSNNGLTYRDMAEEVEADCGIRLSTSAIQRYAVRYNRDAKQLRLISERMRQIERYMEAHSPADLSAYIAALIQDGLLRRIQDGQDEIDDIPIADALKLSIQANRASAYVYRYRDQTIVREEADNEQITAERINWLRQALRKNPTLLREIMEEETGCGMVRSAGNDGNRTEKPPESGGSRT